MAEMFLIAALAFLLGQFLPRNWPSRVAEWRDRMEGRATRVEDLSVDDLVQAIFSHPARDEILRRVADEAKRLAEEVRARAEERKR